LLAADAGRPVRATVAKIVRPTSRSVIPFELGRMVDLSSGTGRLEDTPYLKLGDVAYSTFDMNGDGKPDLVVTQTESLCNAPVNGWQVCTNTCQ
jgi:hypothetical protein